MQYCLNSALLAADREAEFHEHSAKYQLTDFQ
jgi:hypothetical protein